MNNRVLRSHSLWALGLAESVSGIGNWITMLAVFSLLVFRGQGGVVESSLVFWAGLVPTLFASPFAGWLCDRLDRKRLMIGSELLSGLVVAGLVFATGLEWIYALLVLQAITMSIMTPARQAAVPDLVSREDLPRANALLSQLAGMVKIGAPMLAGLILTLLDPHTAILLDALSFLLSALILSRLPALPPRRRPTPVSTHGALPAQTGHEPTLLATLGRSAGLRLLLSATFLTVVVIIGFDALASVFVRDVLHGDERLFGLLIGLVGLGTVGAAGALLWRPTNRDPWRDLVLGIVLLAVVPASLAVAAHLAASPGGTVRGLAAVQAVAAFGCLVGGLGNGLVVVQSGTLLQTLSPGSLLGQMAGAVQSTRVAGQMAGLLITPLLVPALLAMDAYLGAAALALLALALGIMLRLHRSRPPQPVLSAAPASAPDPAAHNTAR